MLPYRIPGALEEVNNRKDAADRSGLSAWQARSTPLFVDHNKSFADLSTKTPVGILNQMGATGRTLGDILNPIENARSAGKWLISQLNPLLMRPAAAAANYDPNTGERVKKFEGEKASIGPIELPSQAAYLAKTLRETGMAQELLDKHKTSTQAVLHQLLGIPTYKYDPQKGELHAAFGEKSYVNDLKHSLISQIRVLNDAEASKTDKKTAQDNYDKIIELMTKSGSMTPEERARYQK